MQFQKHVIISAVLALSCSFISGCGGPDMPGTDPPSQVLAVLTGINDAAGDEETFKSVFAGGSAPEDRGKYFNAKIEVVGTPEVTGDQATVKVKISQGAAESEGDEGPKEAKVTEGEVTWTLQKEGEDWKIKDAPLP